MKHLLIVPPLAAAILSPAALRADEVIDGGEVITVPGSHATPWPVTGNLHVGSTGAGTLGIGAGGQVTSRNGFIGHSAGSVGNVGVSGTDALWRLTPPSGTIGTDGLYVGYSGQGTLAISGGGRVEILNSSAHIGYNVADDAAAKGEVTVTGAGSSFHAAALLTVGRIGNGSLTISNGGTVTSQTGIVGQQTSGTGSLLVTGAGSNWTTSTISVGTEGSSVRIADKGKIDLTGTYVQLAGSTVVTGEGSLLKANNLRVSTGFVLENGARIESQAASHVGYESGAAADLTITGAGSEWSSVSSITVSRTGAGADSSLTVTDGGAVTVDGGTGSIILSAGNNTTGTLNIGNGGAAGIVNAATISGATSSLRTGKVNFNHTGTTTLSASITGNNMSVTTSGPGTSILTGDSTYRGATTVGNGKLVNNGSLGNTTITVMDNAIYGGSGTHTGATVIESGGTFAPGASIGIMNTGSLHLIGGAIYEWELGDATGAAGTGWDTVEVTGAMSFASTEANPFTLTLEKAGALTNFDPLQSYQFVIANAVGGITGFNEEFVTIDASAIPESGTGAWALGQSGNSLILSYSAVPEPSAALLGALGLLAAVRRRRAC
ncbi:hypothetical protein OKA04_12535 [Luteolibacter flavescens]|uniref:PEP-CTERM sorting domain-containing protein n=1 Tax=Luteolibacter flavescens TaxID=1859460 RepID=A0ABT3FPS2_9BACT|nr:PEP-CTERM sorting domain-containing protein [Luteolibacter flavescens]MCW1885558.1 hypothetical protein [Luteolibacter flavescens]